MIIGIDGNEANLPIKVGVGQYAFNILWELYRQDDKNTYHIYLKSPPATDLPPATPNWIYHVFGPQKLWTKLALPLYLYLQNFSLDFFISPSHYSPHFSPYPTIPTIHDLGYLDTPEQFNRKDIYQLIHWTKRSIRQAHRIIAVSEFTKNEIHRIYQVPLDQIIVVPNGVGQKPILSRATVTQVLKKYSLHSRFFITLGTLKPNKNIPFLLESFHQFLSTSSSRAKYQLVIAGKKGWLFHEIFTKVSQLKLKKKVVFTDYITETEKWALLQSAWATVLPSTYEGFGIPAIESQLVNTPVIASQIPAYQEVLQKSALLIDPHQPATLVKALQLICQSPIQKKLIIQGQKTAKLYTWQKSAKTLIDNYSKL